ncbi:hypothetical protein [Paenibacillus sp. FSL P4-0288]|uniref:hypothetical protein n=1 Tax=Paenibacillus sp. FSL P4-0288 TaxID=2921633 RepID=UPI0030F672B2
MKNELGIVNVVECRFLLSECGSDKPTTVTRGGEPPSKQVTTQPEQNTKAKLIKASENKEKVSPHLLYSSEGLLAVWK